MFQNRKDAGRELAESLIHYKDEDVLVLAIPRGGAEVGFEVAKAIQADFSLLIARKLPFPNNPEAGFGAIAEDGSIVILHAANGNLAPETIQQIIKAQKKEIQRRINILRGGKPLPQIMGRSVILVDDGIAMGSTMRAAVKLCTNREARKIVIASPVASPEVKRAFARRDEVTEIVVSETPRFFRAVAQVYEEWHDVTDHEVLAVMNRWQSEFVE